MPLVHKSAFIVRDPLNLALPSTVEPVFVP